MQYHIVGYDKTFSSFKDAEHNDYVYRTTSPINSIGCRDSFFDIISLTKLFNAFDAKKNYIFGVIHEKQFISFQEIIDVLEKNPDVDPESVIEGLADQKLKYLFHNAVLSIIGQKGIDLLKSKKSLKKAAMVNAVGIALIKDKTLYDSHLEDIEIVKNSIDEPKLNNLF